MLRNTFLWEQHCGQNSCVQGSRSGKSNLNANFLGRSWLNTVK